MDHFYGAVPLFTKIISGFLPLCLSEVLQVQNEGLSK